MTNSNNSDEADEIIRRLRTPPIRYRTYKITILPVKHFMDFPEADVLSSEIAAEIAEEIDNELLEQLRKQL